MNHPLVHDLDRFLTALEQTQGEMLELLTTKSAVLRQPRRDSLIRLSEKEGELARRLQVLVAQRARLLDRALEEGISANSLTKLVGAIGADAEMRSSLEDRIRRAGESSAKLRHESWIHWIVSHKCFNHYTELLELIAHGGQAAPIYSKGAQVAATGGVLLDASI